MKMKLINLIMFPALLIVAIIIALCGIFGKITIRSEPVVVELSPEELEKLNSPSPSLGKARIDFYDNIPVVHLYGTPEEMGQQYGTLVKKPLSSMVFMINFAMDKEIKEFLYGRASKLEKNLPPAMRKEMKALAKAAGVEYEDVVAINLTPRLNCSTLAVSKGVTRDGKMLMGRNLDYPSYGMGTQISLIVVYHPEKGNSFVAFTALGMVGAYTGINNDGVCFGNMLVFNAKNDGFNYDGMSIQLLLRQAAEQSNTTDAFVKFLEKQQHVIPMNVMVADKNTATLVELGIDDTATRNQTDGKLAAANHFREEKLHDGIPGCPRYRTLIDYATENAGKFDVKLMKKAIADTALDDLNLQAIIFEPELMRVHVSMNRPIAAKGPYTTFDVNKLIEGSKDPVIGQPGKSSNADAIRKFY